MAKLNQQPIYPQLPTIGVYSPVFTTALQEDSNVETNWLWAATQVTHSAEYRYCLERALYINPDNDVTQQTLTMLNRQAGTKRSKKSGLLSSVLGVFNKDISAQEPS